MTMSEYIDHRSLTIVPLMAELSIHYFGPLLPLLFTSMKVARYSFSATFLTVEALKAGVWQVIACMKFASFLTPDMASKNDARHGIE